MSEFKISEHLWFMSMALEEAGMAYNQAEVPVGSVLVSPAGEVISRSFNLKEKNFDPFGHAEILSMKEAALNAKNWRLEGATLYVTLEPCPMCLAAMVQARIKKLVFGAYDPKGGALSLGYNLYDDKRLNHSFSVIGGIKHFECSKLISQFFREKRGQYKNKSDYKSI